jgi:hypothetical protein
MGTADLQVQLSIGQQPAANNQSQAAAAGGSSDLTLSFDHSQLGPGAIQLIITALGVEAKLIW